MEFDDIIKIGRRENSIGKELFAVIENREWFLTRLLGEDGELETAKESVVREVNAYPKDLDLVIKLYKFENRYFKYRMVSSEWFSAEYVGTFDKGTGRERSIRIMFPKEYDVELLI